MSIRKLIFLGTILFCQESYAAITQQKLPSDVSQQALERIDEGYHLGTVIGVIDETGTRYYSFGRMSLARDAVPDENSVYEIGSITKCFTAVLVTDLELDGKLSVTDPIDDYLPVFKDVMMDSDRTITLESLMTHTSGLPRNPLNTDPNDDDRYKNYSVEDLQDFLANYAVSSSQTGYSYSNAGILVLEHAIETKLGKSYEELMTSRVLGELGMNDSFFAVPEGKTDDMAIGFRDGVQTDAVDVGQFPAMGGLRTTAKDMLTYLGAQVGLIPTPLSDAIAATHDIRYADENVVLSLGWRILHREESGKTIYHFSGGTNGIVSFAAFDLENQKGVVILVNGRRWFSDLGFRLLDPTYPLNDPDPPPKP